MEKEARMPTGLSICLQQTGLRVAGDRAQKLQATINRADGGSKAVSSLVRDL